MVKEIDYKKQEENLLEKYESGNITIKELIFLIINARLQRDNYKEQVKSLKKEKSNLSIKINSVQKTLRKALGKLQ